MKKEGKKDITLLKKAEKAFDIRVKDGVLKEKDRLSYIRGYLKKQSAY